MRLHILGICGTFMSGVAIIAKQCGHEVSGSDANVYPPMSTQLIEQGISISEGYDAANIPADVDCVIVGNIIRRGNPALEYVLAQRIAYTSGPQWLAENVLHKRHVLAVAGTHGKTTTTSLLTWLLEYAGKEPGFLVGGVPENFGVSARFTNQDFFVIEADEYDSAFFDKRAKFLHYRPQTLILNNLEYDHADIFPNLQAIKQQFHFLLRTIPPNGNIIHLREDNHLADVLAMGCWTPCITFGNEADWQATLIHADGSAFSVYHRQQFMGEVKWSLLGNHNVANALAAIAAAVSVGVPATLALPALTDFKNVKRRLEIKGQPKNIFIYDDFAHHPTAIATTLNGLRAKIGEHSRMIAVLEFGSYTMRTGVHKEKIQEALRTADSIVCKKTELDWGLEEVLKRCTQPTAIYNDVDTLVAALVPTLQSGDHVVVMSNSGFGGIHQKLIAAIENGK